MRIGIYGGSFDPIHKGHIKLAKYAIKALNLDKLLIIPSFMYLLLKIRELALKIRLIWLN
ncbi:adenylyltransferase/cytidyltransferase family protein [Mycoplasmopsis cynos]|uniref:adenylyltransferase/cytidyltransferase family protein n=1 Tax=Mycoplasmopsis cynos TaxID=171284 RepID=UPI002200C499|nr:adenylyltransferase/cytidyltransferase family protein [Mycoplasmopsis cynos]UWV83211.1 adenylyltransferase/cytidyltransferase family protein [Mycoplasmopsis cynos]